MTLTIELTPEQEARLHREAVIKGLPMSELARLRVIAGAFPAVADPLQQKKSALGKYAGLGPSVDEFLREKHAETAREEVGLSKADQAA